MIDTENEPRPDFVCMDCGEPVSEDQMVERIKNPPGGCVKCGCPVVAARGVERLKELHREHGLDMSKMVTASQGKGFVGVSNDIILDEQFLRERGIDPLPDQKITAMLITLISDIKPTGRYVLHLILQGGGIPTDTMVEFPIDSLQELDNLLLGLMTARKHMVEATTITPVQKRQMN